MLAHGSLGSLDELLVIGVPVLALVLFDRSVRKRRREAALFMLKQAKGNEQGSESPTKTDPPQPLQADAAAEVEPVAPSEETVDPPSE